MASEQINHLVVILESVKILGPAAIAAVVSICISRNQLQSKTKELQATARLRARELMFEAYQKHLEDVVEDSAEIAKSCGRLLAILATESDETLKARAKEDVQRTLPTFKDLLIQDYNDIEKDEEFNKHDDLKRRLREAKVNIENLNLQNIEPEECVRALMRGYNVLGECETELIHRRSKELFGEWL